MDCGNLVKITSLIWFQFLLRMIDDFLLVTTDLPLAEKFLQVMHTGMFPLSSIRESSRQREPHAGFPDYGCHIAPEKSLTSFRPSKQPYTTNICTDQCELIDGYQGSLMRWCCGS